jgi:hypothetical protein
MYLDLFEYQLFWQMLNAAWPTMQMPNACPTQSFRFVTPILPGTYGCRISFESKIGNIFPVKVTVESYTPWKEDALPVYACLALACTELNRESERYRLVNTGASFLTIWKVVQRETKVNPDWENIGAIKVVDVPGLHIDGLAELADLTDLGNPHIPTEPGEPTVAFPRDDQVAALVRDGKTIGACSMLQAIHHISLPRAVEVLREQYGVRI